MPKDAARRHRAPEHQMDSARKATLMSLGLAPRLAPSSSATGGLDSGGPSRGASGVSSDALSSSRPGSLSANVRRLSSSLPDVSRAGLSPAATSSRPPPEATFTPTAAGLRPEEDAPAAGNLDLPSLLSSLSSLLAAGLPQSGQPPLRAPSASTSARGRHSTRPRSPVREEAGSSANSDQGEDFPEDLEFSEDEGLAPDAPAFTGLFRPALFRSLLHKARLAMNFSAPETDPNSGQLEKGPLDSLFKLSKPDKDCIPLPQLFSEVIKSPWTQPGYLTAPSSLDKKLYCASQELDDMLALALVDAPVAALSTSSALSADSMDGLKAEDRKTELTFRKSHQADAWAIRAATAASFFNRATLIWL